MAEPKKGTGKHPGKNMVGDFIQTKTLETLLRSSSQRQKMREKQYRKLKRFLNRLLGKFKY